MPQKTVLNDTHRALGAKMVDFGGWDMPINYGSQIEEHHQVRRDAGMFDVSHMTILDLRGDRVRLGFTGPTDVPIHREEVFQRLCEEDRAAARSQEVCPCL